ncbi:MAG TPA: AMIN domain-containing protein, partial [Clostridiales bacterium]|nr:AMIN domain-containing protein [Clostridiales bacterium]
MKRVISFILIISVVFLTTVSSVYAENRTGTVPDGGSLPADASSTGAALPDELPADTGLPGNPSHSGKRNAAGEPDGGRRLENIDFFTDGLYETVNISAPGFTDYYITELADPARIVIDLVDLDVPEGQGIIRTDGAYVKRIRYAQFTERIARVVLDVNEGYDFSIV